MSPRKAGLVLLLVAPMVALMLSPWKHDGTLVYLGMLPAGVGLLVGRNAALVAGPLTALCMAIGVSLSDWPLVGAVFMTVLGACVGFSAVRGWHGIGGFVGPQTAFALIGGPLVALPSGTVSPSTSLGALAAMAGWVAFGGLWTAMVGGALTSGMRLPGPRPVPERAATYFGLALATLAGVATYVAMGWVGSPNAWWLLLTLFVVVQPYFAATLSRTVARVGGTLAGAVLAGLVAHLLSGSPGVLSVVALVLTGAAAWAYLKQPYWVFTLFLTPAVILQTSGGEDVVLAADLERALFTVAAALVAVAVLAVGHRVLVSRDRAVP
ncbi:FUSC family protein [Oerskovia sp. Sa1BUA8]|uniref:FUSC family protein n=1 Tax=Oerskovia douganii TaxID=2762210 RepID=A0A9D5U7U1_9CELL|nr:FUSC family protein [Oerskovia douganii]MBE7700113.1 FUSC family protein [Oerskovia douganii]